MTSLTNGPLIVLVLLKSLRDIEWSNMRRAAEKKMTNLKENEMKSEDEKINMRPLTALDEIVLDVLGKGNGTTQKSEVLIPDNASFIDPAFMARIKYEEDEDEDNLGDDNEDLADQVRERLFRGIFILTTISFDYIE